MSTTKIFGNPNRLQSRLTMTRSEWKEYRQLLVEERVAGRVVGWTNVPRDDGRVLVLVTHAGGTAIQ